MYNSIKFQCNNDSVSQHFPLYFPGKEQKQHNKYKKANKQITWSTPILVKLRHKYNSCTQNWL